MKQKNINTNEDISAIKQYVLLRQDKEDIKTISISSISRDISKVNLAIELAKSIAAEKYKTLLIDLDLYSPGINKKLGLINERGITDYVGKVSKKQETIIKINNYLDVILTGSEIKYIENFLISSILNNAIIELSKDYEVVIINNSPFKKISDVEGPSNYADTAILCVAQNNDLKKDLVKVNKFIDEVSLNLLGIVVTSAKTIKPVAKKQSKNNMRNVVFDNKIKFTTKETIKSKQFEKIEEDEDDDIEPRIEYSRHREKAKKHHSFRDLISKRKVSKFDLPDSYVEEDEEEFEPTVRKRKSKVKKTKQVNRSYSKRVTKKPKKTAKKNTQKAKKKKSVKIKAKVKPTKKLVKSTKVKKPTKVKKQVIKKKTKVTKVNKKPVKTNLSQQDRIRAALANQKLKDRLKSKR